MSTKYLTVEEILLVHYKVIEDYGGSHGVQDEGRLASLEAAPKQVVFGVEQYASLYEKAAVYMRNVIGDHPFTDGNKRSGVTVAGIFLLRNKKALMATPKELEDFAVQVAVEYLDIEEIAQWLEDHVQ